MQPITFEIPLKAESASNLREHWRARHARVKRQRAATAYRIPPAMKGLGPFLVITLTRRSKRRLDDDNVRGALKAFRDQVAATLRIDDASRLVRWDYAQEVGDDAVVVTVSLAEGLLDRQTAREEAKEIVARIRGAAEVRS
jgi:hypothetical protein